MMHFYSPTKILFGRGCIQDQGHLFTACGHRALIVTGRKSARIDGSLHDVQKALAKQAITSVVFDRVESNPSTTTAREAAEIAVREGVDFVIGIGGGSPLDAAKAAAVLARNKIDDEQLFSNQLDIDPLPVVAVPTTAGTGSEVTQYAMMTNDKVRSKSFIISDGIFPRFAFLDPTYTDTLPQTVTIHTALDALSHLVESYLSRRASAMSSFVAREGIKVMGSCLPGLDAISHPDGEVREKLLYASLLGGMVISQTGTTALHAMGYSLTYFKKIDHGRANALLMYEYLKYLTVDHEEKVREVIGMLGLNGLDEFRRKIDGLIGPKEALSNSEIADFSSIAMSARNIPFTLTIPEQRDLERIFRSSFSMK